MPVCPDVTAQAASNYDAVPQLTETSINMSTPTDEANCSTDDLQFTCLLCVTPDKSDILLFTGFLSAPDDVRHHRGRCFRRSTNRQHEGLRDSAGCKYITAIGSNG